VSHCTCTCVILKKVVSQKEKPSTVTNLIELKYASASLWNINEVLSIKSLKSETRKGNLTCLNAVRFKSSPFLAS
jgi:hypothetical protein